jgi:hypothetical protein
MRHSLLLLGVIAALAIGAPAYSQYIYYDVNGDGVNGCPAGNDILTSSTTSVDVWLDSNHGKDGVLDACSAGTGQPLDFFSYSIIFHTSGAGSVTMNSWTNTAPGFTVITPLTLAGQDGGVDYTAPVGGNLIGLVKLGTLGISVTGSPVLTFLDDNSSNPGISTPVTGFGSTCDGTTYLNTIALHVDFQDVCFTQSQTPVESTTWGKIKQLYR